MSKINEIQNKLGELNGGEFQKLMDAYFSKKYQGTLYPIGSVLANNNTKTGTPDTLILPKNEKYIFIEYTVQKSNIVSKFKDDISKCLDEEKTGIPKDLIGKIICCCNSRLGTNEIEELISIGRENDITIEVITLDSVAYELIETPVIIKDFLGISIDTQQILEVEDFIRFNDSAKLATPLNVDIFGRDEEIGNILRTINEEQIIVISGLPGVGKTRLTLEVMKRFKEEHSDYKLKCLRNNGQNLFDDLNLYFSEPGQYLLMIDDANLLTNIHLILDLFGWESKGINIKLILTVRDYAEEKVIDKISKYSFKTFKLKPLNEESIKLLCEYFDVRNSHFIERIYEISKGNPRLAIMSCITAKKENKLSSLSNALNIVETYYREIKSYFDSDLQNEELLKVGTLLSFLNQVNLKDDANLELLCNIVNLNKESFVNNVNKLHNMEIVDIYDNELAKVSDQILSVYIFYLSVFKKKSLSYKTLIDSFYPSLKGRIVENVNNVFSYFYNDETQKTIKSAIKQVFEERKQSFEEEELEEFLITFWFALEIEGLLYAKKKIDSFEMEKYIDDISFEIKNSNNHSNILILLGCYKNSDYYAEAIDLILLFLEKKPSEFSSVYKVLTENFGINELSDVQGYIQELELFRKIEQSYVSKKNILYENLLTKTIEYFLSLGYKHTRMKNNKTFVIYRIPVYYQDKMVEIRRRVWNKYMELYKQEINLNDLHKILYNYGRINDAESIDKNILKFDKEFIESIINDIEDITLEQSILFNKLKKFFNRYEINFNNEIDKKIETKEFLLYKQIFSNPKYEESDRAAKEEELKKWSSNLTDEEFQELFIICKQVTTIDFLNSNNYIAGQRLETLLANLPSSKKCIILIMFFELNIKINIHPYSIIKNVRNLYELEKNILPLEFFNKSYWLYCIYKEMSLRRPNKDLLNKIYDYFNQPEGEVAGYYRDINFIESFMDIDEDVFINVINLLLKQEDIVVLRSLEPFMLQLAKNDEFITRYLKDDINLLKTIYLRFLSFKQHFDYDSTILKMMVRRNSVILKEIVFCNRKVQRNAIKNAEVCHPFNSFSTMRGTVYSSRHEKR